MIHAIIMLLLITVAITSMFSLSLILVVEYFLYRQQEISRKLVNEMFGESVDDKSFLETVPNMSILKY